MNSSGAIDVQPTADTRTLDRTQKLLAAGHSWLPAQSLFALASSPADDHTILGTADAIRKATTQGFQAKGIKPDDGFKLFTDDPVLQKSPSTALALKTYLTGAVGQWPVEDTHLEHIQQQLQAKGFATDAQPNGVWDQSWDAAYRQFTHEAMQDQLAGKKSGGFTIGHALHILTAVLPKEAGNAILGYVKALPGQFRDLAADSIAGTVDIGAQAYRLTGQSSSDQAHRSMIGAGGNVERWLGNHITNADYAKQTFGASDTSGHNASYRTSGGRLLQDVGNLFLLHSAMKTGAALSTSIGENLLKGGADAELAQSAAQRGPGTIANSFGRVAKSNAYNNIPILGRTGPVIGQLADADGLYYRARTLMASPYKFGAVRAAGDVVSDAGILGAKVRGTAALSGMVAGGPGTSLSRGVQNEHTLDAVDDAVKHRLQFTVLGAHIQPGLDDLAFFLHGPVHGPNSAYNKVGNNVDDVLDGFHNALGDTGLAAQIERGTGTPLPQLIKDAGGEENFLKFWTDHIDQHTASWHAERQLRDLAPTTDEGMPLSGLEKLDELKRLSHEVRNDPAAMTAARRDLLAQNDGLALRIQREITNSRINGYAHPYESKGIQDYLSASDIMRNEVLPHLAPEALGPHPLASDLSNGAKYGIAKNEVLTVQSARHEIKAIREEYAALDARTQAATEAGGNGPQFTDTALLPTAEEHMAVDEKLRKFLFENFLVDGTKMPQDRAGMMDVANEFAGRLAADVVPMPDAPPELLAAMNKLNDRGYKLITGTDVGHMHVQSTYLDAMEGPLTARRKIIEHVGLNPDRYDPRSIGAVRNDGIRNAIADTVDTGKVKLPPYWTPDTVKAYASRADVLGEPYGRLKSAALTLSKGPKEADIAEVMRLNPTLTKAEAADKARNEIIGALQLRDIPRKKFIEALTNPEKFAEHAPESAAMMADEAGVPVIAPFTEAEANHLYRAVVKGSAMPKSYMLGLSRADDLFRASMGFAGSGMTQRAIAGGVVGAGAAVVTGKRDAGSIVGGAAIGAGVGAVGGDRLGWAMANLPNRLIQLRNDLRFDLSPYFSARRLAKTNFKMGLEGVSPVLNPLKVMENAGTLEHDKEVLRRVYPELSNDLSDDADRYLRSNDIFGLYNARHYEAYAAGNWARAGKSDDEIRTLITKTFSYGTRRGEGRSALERSANYLFFPFSFDRSLYRNFGGYLLDRPAQQILLTRGLAAYHDFNQSHLDGSNPLASSWYEKHVPVLEEALRLNAFAHGVSAGEPGGINRPLLNMFLPQSWTPSAQNSATLKRFIPAINDFNRIAKESFEQGSIMKTAGDDMYRKLNGIPSTYGNPRPSAMTNNAQLEEAFNMQRDWFTSYAKILDHNASAKDSQKVRFPLSDEWGKWAGEPISKTNIRDIIAVRYPAYDPYKAADTALRTNGALTQYLLDTKGAPLHDYVQKFVDNAKKLASALGDDKIPAAQAQIYTAQMRQSAAYVAERDPKFYKLYEKNFRRTFGPLEAVK